MTNLLVMGAGLIGSRHVAAVQAHPECTLAGVVDPAGVAMANTPIFADIAQVDVPVDGVIIATPTSLHAAHGEAAAARGWHMLIEKPVTANVDEAAQLQDTLARHNVRALVGHHRRYHPSIQMLRAVVADGRIGVPVTSTLIWAMRKHDGYFDTDWRKSGGSPVMINLVHDIDLLRYVLGEVVDIAGLGVARQREAGRVESGGALLRFESGAVAAISFADTAPSPWGFEAATDENPNIATTRQDMWWITGTAGGISFPSLTLWGGANDWGQAPTAQTLTCEQTSPLHAQLSHLTDVIAGRTIPVVDIADATRTLKVTRELEDMLADQIE